MRKICPTQRVRARHEPDPPRILHHRWPETDARRFPERGQITFPVDDGVLIAGRAKAWYILWNT